MILLCVFPLLSYGEGAGLVSVEGHSKYEVEPDVLKITVKVENINKKSVAEGKDEVDSMSNQIVFYR